MKYLLACMSFCLIIATACKEPLPEDEKVLAELEKAIEADASKEKVSEYLNELGKFVAANQDDEARIYPYLQKGADVSQEHSQWSKAAGFLQALVKEYPNAAEAGDHLWSLADLMRKLRKDHAANVLYHGFTTRFSDDSRNPEAKEIYQSGFAQVDTFMDRMFNGVFEDPDQFGLNRDAALKYVDAAEAYALGHPDSATSPHHLYRAAEIARSIRTMPKSLSIYDWILDHYDGYEKAPTVLFLKGFVMENELNQLDQAQEIYQSFLQKYPEHELASSVKFLIENIGKSDEEILEFIEQRRDEQTTDTE